MPDDLSMILDLFVPILIGFVAGIGVEKLSSKFDRDQRRAFWQGRNSAKRQTPQLRSIASKAGPEQMAANQLTAVMKADFKPRALLNKPERRLLQCIDRILLQEAPGWRAMGQVSLGEILYSHNRDAFWAINAKRVDLLIIDQDCRPLHAIEFQGTGHHGSSETAARDAVKKEALRRAGIGYIEVLSGDTPAELRDTIRKLVGHKPPQAKAIPRPGQALSGTRPLP